ncbi:MAG: DUF1080 domain-containing protein [Bacteroidaceae bacterium]|nr:DUF1080 domain-containing protein [Bacteroidaceae bacterium]
MNKKLTLVALAAAFATTAFAQQPQAEKKPVRMTHEMSEYFEPIPTKVTPGDILTHTAPSDAIVLFDGKNLDAWKSGRPNVDGPAEWPVHDGVFTVDKKKGDIITKQSFTNYQLHIEWCIPENITGKDQARGNSGIYMQDKYEIQVLDSWDNPTYVNGQAGSVYKQYPPMVNPCRKPGEWNVYDIIYTAPVFKADGSYLYHPRVTVIFNGVVVQNNTMILGTTEWIGFPKVAAHGAGPIRLQSHGDPSEPISYRNIWIRELN